MNQLKCQLAFLSLKVVEKDPEDPLKVVEKDLLKVVEKDPKDLLKVVEKAL
jgi:hypothetical protein